MDTFEAINTRRAVKHYDATFEMPAKDEETLFKLVRQSPTSFNLQNWRFVVVKDKALRNEIRAAAWNQAQVTDASLLIILCADLDAWKKRPERYWENAPKEVQNFLVPAIGQFYQGREQVQRDEAMRSVGIAAQTLMLAAKAMGYESSPMVGFDAEQVGKLIHLPKDHVIGMMLAIGKGIKPAQAKGGFLPDHEVFIQNRFA